MAAEENKKRLRKRTTALLQYSREQERASQHSTAQHTTALLQYSREQERASQHRGYRTQDTSGRKIQPLEIIIEASKSKPP